jgi:hypothetical protein
MSNHHASFGPSGTHFAPPNRYGGRVQAPASGELALPLNNGTWFIVEGAGTINRLPSSALRTSVLLRFNGAATLTHSTNLVMPGSANRIMAAGDAALLVPEADNVWRCVGIFPASGNRELLTADRTYYVATTGSNSNSGLSATAPFLTLQKAADVLSTLDMMGYKVTVQIADGTYTSGVAMYVTPPGCNSAADIVFQGNSGTPANVVISTTSANCFTAGSNLTAADFGTSAVMTVKDMQLQTTTSGNCLSASNGGSAILFENVRFGTCVDAHIDAHHNAFVKATGNYAVVGSAARHIFSASGAIVVNYILTITYSNTPNFSIANFYVAGGEIFCGSITFTNGGTVTGVRYILASGSIITGGTTSLTYIPGSSPGVYETNTEGGFIDGGVPWTSYTPTVSAASGTITSYTAVGRWSFGRDKRTIHVAVKITLTNAGSAAGAIKFTLPFTTANDTVGYVGVGVETAAVGYVFSVYVPPNDTLAGMQKYDGTFRGSTGDVLNASLTYQAA